MKKTLTAFLLLFLSFQWLEAQDPGINYQAVARDHSGSVLSNTTVNVRFQIFEGSLPGTLVYQETFAPTTNDFGLFYLVIGEGNAEVGNFSQIDWSAGDHYLITEINGSKIDTTAFRTVPYSKVATDMELSDLKDVDDAAPTNGQTLIWDGIQWTPGTADDADADPNNEIQTLGLSGHTLNLSPGGGSVVLTDNVDDADADPNNEIQSLGLSGQTLTLSPGGGSVVLTDNVDDADADPNNEIQTLNYSGNTLSLSPGGGSVNITSSPWSSSGSSIYYNSGHVGIGDNSPAAALTVGSGDKFQVKSTGEVYLTDPMTGIHFPDVSNASNSPMINMFETGIITGKRMVIAHSPIYPGWGLQYENDRDVFLFKKTGLFGIVQTPVLHIGLRNENIGIATDTPDAKLHIVQNDVSDQSKAMYIQMSGTNSASSSLTRNFGIKIDLNAEGSLLYGTGVASISEGSSFSNYGLYGHAVNANYNFGVYGYAQGSSSRGVSGITDGNYSIGVYGEAHGSGVYAGYFQGDVYTTGSYLPSDVKLKEDLEPYRDGLDMVMALVPERYQYRAEMREKMNLPEGVQYGFVAQDVKKVLPQLTKESYQAPLPEIHGEMSEEERGEAMESEEEGISFLAVNYTGMIPIIVSAVQEQQRIIEEKNARIEQLERELDAMNKRLERLERSMKVKPE